MKERLARAKCSVSDNTIVVLGTIRGRIKPTLPSNKKKKNAVIH